MCVMCLYCRKSLVNFKDIATTFVFTSEIEVCVDLALAQALALALDLAVPLALVLVLVFVLVADWPVW